MSTRINKQFGGIGENTQIVLTRILNDKLPPSVINITALGSEFSDRLSGLYNHVEDKIYRGQNI